MKMNKNTYKYNAFTKQQKKWKILFIDLASNDAEINTIWRLRNVSTEILRWSRINRLNETNRIIYQNKIWWT